MLVKRQKWLNFLKFSVLTMYNQAVIYPRCPWIDMTLPLPVIIAQLKNYKLKYFGSIHMTFLGLNNSDLTN